MVCAWVKLVWPLSSCLLQVKMKARGKQCVDWSMMRVGVSILQAKTGVRKNKEFEQKYCTRLTAMVHM